MVPRPKTMNRQSSCLTDVLPYFKALIDPSEWRMAMIENQHVYERSNLWNGSHVPLNQIRIYSETRSKDTDYIKKYCPSCRKCNRRRAKVQVSSVCFCAELRCCKFVCLPTSLLTPHLIAKLGDQLPSHADSAVSSSRSHMGITGPDVDWRCSRGEIFGFLA